MPDKGILIAAIIIIAAIIEIVTLYLRSEFRKQDEKDDDLSYYRKFSSH